MPKRDSPTNQPAAQRADGHAKLVVVRALAVDAATAIVIATVAVAAVVTGAAIATAIVMVAGIAVVVVVAVAEAVSVAALALVAVIDRCTPQPVQAVAVRPRCHLFHAATSQSTARIASSSSGAVVVVVAEAAGKPSDSTAVVPNSWLQEHVSQDAVRHVFGNSYTFCSY